VLRKAASKQTGAASGCKPVHPLSQVLVHAAPHRAAQPLRFGDEIRCPNVAASLSPICIERHVSDTTQLARVPTTKGEMDVPLI
jgi:hypothetical protein